MAEKPKLGNQENNNNRQPLTHEQKNALRVQLNELMNSLQITFERFMGESNNSQPIIPTLGDLNNFKYKLLKISKYRKDLSHDEIDLIQKYNKMVSDYEAVVTNPQTGTYQPFESYIAIPANDTVGYKVISDDSSFAIKPEDVPMGTPAVKQANPVTTTPVTPEKTSEQKKPNLFKNIFKGINDWFNTEVIGREKHPDQGKQK